MSGVEGLNAAFAVTHIKINHDQADSRSAIPNCSHVARHATSERAAD